MQLTINNLSGVANDYTYLVEIAALNKSYHPESPRSKLHVKVKTSPPDHYKFQEDVERLESLLLACSERRAQGCNRCPKYLDYTGAHDALLSVFTNGNLTAELMEFHRQKIERIAGCR